MGAFASRSASAGVGKWLAVALGLLCASGALYLSIPRAVGAFFAAPGDPVFDRVRAGKEASLAELRTLAISRHRALVWTDAPRAWSELSYAEMKLAVARPGSDGRPDPAMLQRALGSTVNALRRSPADSDTWLRLAAIRLMTEGATPRTAAAYGMALLTAPVAPRQIAYRLDFGFRIWGALSADDRRLVFQLVRSGWRHAPHEVVATATTPARTGIVRAALLTQLKDLAAFDRWLAERAKAGAR